MLDPDSPRDPDGRTAMPDPQPVSPARRVLVPVVGLLALAAACGAFVHRFYSDPGFLVAHDFLTYWGAGRLFVTGGNPYDGAELLAVQKAAGRPHDYPTSMWYPPWAYSLVGPFGLLDARTAQLVWVVAQFVLIVLATGWAWRLCGGDRDQTWIAWMLAALAPMTWGNAYSGQASGWGMFGLVGFLAAAMRGKPHLAALAALCSLKPHLFVPFWILLVLDATWRRSGRARLAWGVAAGLTALVVPILIYPNIWTLYRDALAHPSTDGHIPLSAWQPPLIGYWIRVWIDPAAFWIQFVPTVLLAIVTPIYWWNRRNTWDWRAEFPRVLFAGMLAAPYGAWDYDLVVLLIPMMAAAVRLARPENARFVPRAVAGWLLFCTAAHLSVVGRFDVWMTPALIALHAWVMWMTRAARGVREAAVARENSGVTAAIRQDREAAPCA